MKKFIATLIVLAISLFTVNSLAWTVPATPKPASAISDSSHVLSADAHKRLDDQLAQINSTTANEIAVLIVSSLDGESIEDVGFKTAKAWGVGKSGQDNGVLIVLAMAEHKSRIETGKGVEGDLPDLACNDILKNVLRPHMKSGDVEGGLKATIDAISSSIASHKAGTTTPSPYRAKSSDEDVAAFVVVFFVLAVFMGIVIFAASRSRRRSSYRSSTYDSYSGSYGGSSSGSSYSSGSSDSGSSSSFGGGDFGGGGSSSDW